MNGSRAYLFVGIAALLLLGISGILGYVFFAMLDAEMAPSPTPVETAPPSGEPPTDDGRPAVTDRPTAGRHALDDEPIVLGLSGTERKYAFLPPTAPPPPEGIVSADVPGPLRRPDLAPELPRAQMPAPFYPECEDPDYIFDFNKPGADYEVYVSGHDIVLHLRRPELERVDGRSVICKCRGREIDSATFEKELIIRMRLHGINQNARGSIGGAGLAKTHYLMGTDARRWFTDIPSYGRVQYLDIYPGIDLMFYGDQNRFEYIFMCRPGADIGSVSYTFDGSEEMLVGPRGNLQVGAYGGKFVQRQPLMYEIIDDRPYYVEGMFNISDRGVSLARRGPRPDTAEERERKRQKPELQCLSYLGGEGDERAYAVTTDGEGHVYVVGETTSPAFGGREPGREPGGGDVSLFVGKYRIADSEPVYTTFLGGGSQDRAFGIAVGADGSAYVCGETLSSDFPHTNGPPIGLGGESWDAFVVKLAPDGSGIDAAFRLGGRGDERAYGVVLDTQTNLYVVGETRSPDFPVSNALAEVKSGSGWDGFIARFDATCSRLDYCTRLGGSGDDAIHAVDVDVNGAVYVTGETSSRDFPLAEALQGHHGGGVWDGFAARISPKGRYLDYCTYLGGVGDDRARGACADLAGNMYIVGENSSGDFPTTNALQDYYAGGDWDMFVTKISADGERLVYSTYLGGSGDDRGFSIAADVSGNAHIGGVTSSTNWTTVAAQQSVHGGGTWDGMMIKLSPGGLTRTYVSYLGGKQDDQVFGVNVDAARDAHFAGGTASPGLATINPVQKDFSGGKDDSLLARMPAGYRPEPPLRLVSGGGQPGGPPYDFYMAEVETTNEEFVRFLNDAQANTNNARGAHMHFDDDGNVWMNPVMQRERDELFNIAVARVDYHPEYPVGSRYAITPSLPPVGGSYSNHPVVGVSWYGAVKYCNWLTVETGRGAEQRCYSEGTNTTDWAPVTVSQTNWNKGFFSPSARERWLHLDGFRLPMDNCWGDRSLPNQFNEFYKAAAWSGGTNMPYAYGRDDVTPGDANYLDHGLFQRHDTAPVGFFNGSDYDGQYATHSNDNFYGIYDLSGNVTEWLNDPGDTNVLADRGCYGGSWMFDLPDLSERFYVSPHFTDRFRGFRVVTTTSREDMFLIRIPYYICLCGYTGPEEEEEEEEIPEIEEEEPIGMIYDDDDDDDDDDEDDDDEDDDDAYLTDKEDFSPAALARARAVLGEDFVSAEGLEEKLELEEPEDDEDDDDDPVSPVWP